MEKINFNEQDLIKQIHKYNWYHEIELTENIRTTGSIPIIAELNKWIKEKINKKIFFKNKKVLDIGCREGLYSFLAEKNGAEEIIGIDNDLSKAATEFLIPFFNSKVKMFELNLYDLTPDKYKTFDIVFMLGVLYHLKFPFWGLKRAADVINNEGLLIISTAVLDIPELEEMEFLYYPSASGGPFGYDSPTYFTKECLCTTMSANKFKLLDSYKFNNEPVNIQLFFFQKDNSIETMKVKGKSLDGYHYSNHDMHSGLSPEDLQEIYKEQTGHIIEQWNKINKWRKKLK